MDAALYIKMLSDKHISNLEKIKYKYGLAVLEEFIQLLKDSIYTSLPILDFNGKPCVYLKNILQLKSSPAKM